MRTLLLFVALLATFMSAYAADSGRMVLGRETILTLKNFADIHGWLLCTETDVPRLSSAVPWEPGLSGGLAPQYYGALTPEAPNASAAPALVGIVDTYTERLFYADSAVPRYTGCPTGRVNILGGRYDYRYDAHDRLTHATYTAATGGSDEDFTVRYTYDNMARPQTVHQQGITEVDADGAETFGPLDILTYTYDDTGRVTAIANDGDGDEYYGRPGFAAGGSEYGWKICLF